MLLLGDRNFAAPDLLGHLAAIGADLLVRCKSGRNLPAVARCRDGSILARLGVLTVRVIDAEITKPPTKPMKLLRVFAYTSTLDTPDGRCGARDTPGCGTGRRGEGDAAQVNLALAIFVWWRN